MPSSKKTIAAAPSPNVDEGSTASEAPTPTDSLPPPAQIPAPTLPPPSSVPDWQTQEQKETAVTLREKQKHVESQVYRIWTVLSTFEESSAAAISDMLRQVSTGYYLDGVKLAERFVLHVEVLFAAIDDLNSAFRHVGGKGKSRSNLGWAKRSGERTDEAPAGW